MSQTIILECSNNNATSQISNAEFEVQPTIPITINNGDAINVKLSILDNKNMDSGQIYLPEDVEIGASIIFYDECFSKGRKSNTDRQVYNDIPEGPYICYQQPSYNETEQTYALTPYEVTIGFKIPAGSYSPEYLSILLTNGFNECADNQSDGTGTMMKFNGGSTQSGEVYTDTPFFVRTTQSNISNVFIGDSQYPQYYYQYDEADDKYYIGANQAVFSYNNNSSNRFEVTYAHTPLFDKNGNTVVVKYNSEYNNVINRFASRRCGIIFTDLQPVNFWQSLGFDLSKLICPLQRYYSGEYSVSSYIDYVDMTNIEESLTTGYISNDDVSTFINNDDNTINGFICSTYPPDLPLIKTSTLTRPVYAISNYFFNTSSNYYLLEISNIFNEYHSDGNITHTIGAIISKNYSSQNYIVSYQWDSVPYIHRGDSLLLSRIKVRILDPISKQPATDIGVSNSIFLQIIRG